MSNFTESLTCPVSFNCTGKGNGNLLSFDIGVTPSYVNIVSCSFSCLGSLLILFTFFILKDLRTTTQKIITLLATADFISAVGYILGSVNFLTHFDQNNTEACNVFQKLCITQSAITSWSSLVSFCWTVILAFHFFLIIVYRRFHIAGKLLPLYIGIAFIGPLLIIVPLLATSKLGFAPYAASNWCFVKDYNYAGLKEDPLTIALILVAGKGWEFLSYVFVTLLYMLIFCRIHQTRHRFQNTQLEPRVQQMEWRLLAIPILFILLRIWGSIQFIVSLALPSSDHGPCIEKSIYVVYLVLGILQAIGDGGQGWGNTLLYIFFSPTIRARLWGSVCGLCAGAFERRLGDVVDGNTATTHKPLNYRARHLNVNKLEDSSSSLVAHKPATGYNVEKYDSTSTCSEDYSGENYEGV